MVERWLSRALVASFLVNCLLAVWLWSARRTTHDVEQSAHEYREARVVYDTVKVAAAESRRGYRAARENLPPVTPEVEEALTLADSAITAGERSEAAADTALARADALISALRKANRPKLIQPWAEVLYSPYSREYVGRIGLDVRTIKSVSLVIAGEARKEGPQALLGVRVRF